MLRLRLRKFWRGIKDGSLGLLLWPSSVSGSVPSSLKADNDPSTSSWCSFLLSSIVTPPARPSSSSSSASSASATPHPEKNSGRCLSDRHTQHSATTPKRLRYCTTRRPHYAQIPAFSPSALRSLHVLLEPVLCCPKAGVLLHVSSLPSPSPQAPPSQSRPFTDPGRPCRP
jgi:hypothetical protein